MFVITSRSLLAARVSHILHEAKNDGIKKFICHLLLLLRLQKHIFYFVTPKKQEEEEENFEVGSKFSTNVAICLATFSLVHNLLRRDTPSKNGRRVPGGC